MANTKVPIELSSTPGIVDNSNATAITIDASENVGIGRTSNIDYLLDVQKPADAYIRISSATTQENAGIILANQNGTKWIIEKDGPSHDLFVKSAAVTAMTISQAGNVGIGTSSPKGKLNTAFFSADNASSSDTTLANSFHQMGAGEYGTGRYFLTTYGYSTSQTNSGAYMGAVGMSGSGVGKYDLVFGTRNVTTDTAPTERLRIDAAGNLGLGVAPLGNNLSPTLQMASGGTMFGYGDAMYLTANMYYNGGWKAIATGGGASMILDASGPKFYTNASASAGATVTPVEIMRVRTTGLIVGTDNAAINAGVGLKLLSGPTFAQFSVVTNSSSGTAINPFIHYNIDSAFPGYRFYTSANGGLANFQTYDTNLSDINEKKNIVPIESTWHCVKEWEIVNYLYNDQPDTDTPNKGVIAQQIELHCPENISEFKKQDQADATYYTDEDELPDGVTVGDLKTEAQEEIVRKGVREQQMLWMAIKTIQECQARIVALEACIEDLKGA